MLRLTHKGYLEQMMVTPGVTIETVEPKAERSRTMSERRQIKEVLSVMANRMRAITLWGRGCCRRNTKKDTRADGASGGGKRHQRPVS